MSSAPNSDGASPGLSAAEARARLDVEGPNELPSARRRGLSAALVDVLREPMFLLLVACGMLYMLLGDRQEAAMLLGFLFVVAGITLYQERKSEHALEALRELSSPRALVMRDGRRQRIPGREVVRGDVLVLAEGDRVPADGVLLACEYLHTDESLLTGESVPVRKVVGDRPASFAPGGDDLPFVFAGTLVTRGHATAEVLATGGRTEMGKIGKALEAASFERTALQQETSGLVRRFAVAGAGMCLAVVLVYGFARADWLGGLLAGLTLAMAIMPNEFPAVLAIFLALGAYRISQSRVLPRRVPAVENLGATTVLCVDKTGTLTENRMAVRKICESDAVFDVGAHPAEPLPEEVHEVVEYGILASQRDPFDPMEKAFHDLGQRRLAGTEHLHPSWRLVRQYPLSEDLLAISHVWRSPDGADYVIAAKGAPEAIADLCHLARDDAERLAARVATMAADGLRVLGVAAARVGGGQLPGAQHDFPFELVGLVGLADPVRPEVPEAIAECHGAGIRVVMITGDHPETAQSIASQIGLSGALMTGRELADVDEHELRGRVEAVSVFARVVPEQKLRIVRAVRAAGEVVAMTGDGVNDAPALKAADIGIAMGGRGTDVAREAAALVLLDDDFASIVRAVRLGRRVFDNLKSAMAYILAIHVPIAGMTLVPVFLGLPLVLMPVHVAFLHLVIEPACSVVFEAEPEDEAVMRRPPRDPRQPLFGRRLVGLSLLQGASVLAIVLTVYLVALALRRGEQEARALTFATLLFANLALIFANRSWTRTTAETLRTPNRALWWVTGGALVFLALALYVRPLRALFRMEILHADDVAICVGAALVSVAWFEVLKLVTSTRSRGGPSSRDAR
jgi:Ca2+-transporting ATPase